ncbi:hypothetical protein HK102_001568 [Quaeritorhiza haematococci]|nr:hypothetical protein HK102_001568 [Quaeritorhiza haematococci]
MSPSSVSTIISSPPSIASPSAAPATSDSSIPRVGERNAIASEQQQQTEPGFVGSVMGGGSSVLVPVAFVFSVFVILGAIVGFVVVRRRQQGRRRLMSKGGEGSFSDGGEGFGLETEKEIGFAEFGTMPAPPPPVLPPPGMMGGNFAAPPLQQTANVVYMTTPEYGFHGGLVPAQPHISVPPAGMDVNGQSVQFGYASGFDPGYGNPTGSSVFDNAAPLFRAPPETSSMMPPPVTGSSENPTGENKTSSVSSLTATSDVPDRPPQLSIASSAFAHISSIIKLPGEAPPTSPSVSAVGGNRESTTSTLRGTVKVERAAVVTSSEPASSPSKAKEKESSSLTTDDVDGTQDETFKAIPSETLTPRIAGQNRNTDTVQQNRLTTATMATVTTATNRSTVTTMRSVWVDRVESISVVDSPTSYAYPSGVSYVVVDDRMEEDEEDGRQVKGRSLTSDGSGDIEVEVRMW